MGLIRSRIGAVALALAASHVVWTGVALTAICVVRPVETTADAGVAADEECHCVHGPDAVCPMHRAQTKRTAGGSSQGPRWCSGCCHDVAMALTVLMTAPGLPAGRYQIAHADTAGQAMVCADARALDFDTSPSSPPPRG